MRPIVALAIAATCISPVLAQAEILAMANYESKPNQPVRREGIAIIDVDPASPNFTKILADIPLPPDLVGHHLFYNKDVSKAYVTGLGSIPLQVMDIKKFPYRLKTVATPDCKVGEDLAFSDDKKRWYLTCMGTSNVIVGDAQTDKALKNRGPRGARKYRIHQPSAWNWPAKRHRPDPRHKHGAPLRSWRARRNGDGDRSLTGKILSTQKVSDKPSPSGVAPVEAVFLPGANPPLAYITTMFGNTLWSATWNPGQRVRLPAGL